MRFVLNKLLVRQVLLWVSIGVHLSVCFHACCIVTSSTRCSYQKDKLTDPGSLSKRSLFRKLAALD